MQLASRICLGLGASLMLCAGAVQAADRALIIGVGTYANLPEERWLDGPKNDTALISTMLTGSMNYKPDALRVLSDAEATKGGIIAAVDEWLVAGTQPGDRVFLYFSGHGVQIPDTNSDEPDGLDEALAPHDVTLAAEKFENVISDDEMDGLIGRLSGRFVTMVFDACHSGTVTRAISGQTIEAEGARFLSHATLVGRGASRGLVVQPIAVDDTTEVVSWSAAAATQLAWDDTRLPAEQRNGVFTAAYVAGIQNGAADVNSNTAVSYTELLAYVKLQSEDYCLQNPDCLTHGLTPQLEAPAAVLGYGVTPLAAENQQAQQPANPAYEAPKPAPEGTAEEYAGKPEEAVMTYVATEVAAPAQTYGGVSDIIGKPSDGVVAMRMVPGASLKKGDEFKVEVTSGSAGYLVLYDIAENGEATQLYPNPYGLKTGMLRPNAPFTMPDEDYGFALKAGAPGKGTMLAIVVQDLVDIEKIAPASRGLSVVPKATEALVYELNEPYVDETKPAEPVVRETKWSYALLPYTIQ